MNRIVLAALLLTASSFGQTGLATVTGTIADATGAVVANAPVEVRNRDNGQVFRGATSDTGNYTLSQLPIGDYDLSVTVPGFKSYAHTNFHLAAAQIMREDVALEVGQTTESVTVTAEASLLKTESSQVVPERDALAVEQFAGAGGRRDSLGSSRSLRVEPASFQECSTRMVSRARPRWSLKWS